MDTGAHLTSLAANRIYCKAYLQLPTREPLQCTAWYLHFILIDIAACFLDLGICVPSLFTPGCTSIFPSFNNFLEIISAEQNQWVQIFFVMFILCTCKSGMRKIFLTSGRRYLWYLLCFSQTRGLLTLEPPGAQTKAAFVSQFVSHLRIKLTSQVWRTEMFLTPHHPSRLCQCTCEICLIYLWKLCRGITLSAKGMTRTLQHTNTDILCGPAWLALHCTYMATVSPQDD